MRVLLVEDDAVLGSVVRHSLQDAGYRVDLATTLAQARHFWRVQPFDAVLLDLNLPDGSGLAALREARARSDRTPALVLTARNRTDASPAWTRAPTTTSASRSTWPSWRRGCAR
jgi:DNA-binding response OmpR family regulator